MVIELFIDLILSLSRANSVFFDNILPLRCLDVGLESHTGWNYALA